MSSSSRSLTAERVALITGAAGGIGGALVDRFLRDGWKVLATDRVAPTARSEVDLCVIEADLGAPDAAERLVRAALDAFGRLDALINNAGIERRASLADHRSETWAEVMDVNLTAPFRLSQAAAAALAQSRGAIVNLVSVAVTGFAGQVAYDVSKGGLQTLTRSLAVELGAVGVRANAIAPGFIRTPMVEAHPDLAEAGRRLVRGLPIARMGEPSEVAAVAAWLASADASYVTGQTIFVDGGWMRH